MTVSANAVERITERQHEMEYDPKPDNLIHEAVEEAVNANPRLALMPYEQMKAAARILAKKIIAAETEEHRARRPGRIETNMNIYGKWDWRILAVIIIGGLIAGWLIG